MFFGRFLMDIKESSDLQLFPPFFDHVAAGFPSPANDYIENHLDLNKLIVKNPSATFFVRVKGDSMKDAGIFSDDILVVDRSLEPAHGKIVVAILNGEFTVKRLSLGPRNLVSLLPANDSYPVLRLSADADFQIWGIVTYVIHRPK